MSNELLDRYPALEVCKEEIKNAAEAIIACYENGGKVMLCGNGGSCADCEHIVGELMKGFILKREVTDERIPEELRNKLQGALPAISLPSQSVILSAYINDVDPEMMYAQLVYGYAKENDLVIATPQTIIDNNITTKYQIWLVVSHSDWVKRDTGPLYNAWVMQADWTKHEYTIEDDTFL
jgi:phosphoheptose isomerase